MDLKSYCDRMEIELTDWKARIYDVIRKTNNLSAGDKEAVDPMIQDLRNIMDGLDERLEMLERECPADWSSQRKEIEAKMSNMDTAWKNVWGVLGESEHEVGDI